jgi:penicillin-binding protein 2
MSWFTMRSNQILTVFFALLLILGIRLFVITGVQGSEWTQAADTNTIKTISTDAPRGAIYDRNGVLLAGNKPSFTVNFARNGLSAEKANASIAKLINILEKHGETPEDSFPILIGSDGKYSYTFDAEIKKWLAAQKLPADMTALEAFDEICRQNDIKPGTGRIEAQKILLQNGINVPVSLQNKDFRKNIEKKSFLERYKKYVAADATAEEAFAGIRTYFGIDPALSAADARSVLNVRHEVSNQGYLQYIPVKVASGLKEETILEVQENEHDLDGVSVVAESVRYYPQGHSASHVIGYLGKISDEKKEEYVTEKKYKPTDLIGLDGIEGSQEDVLHGTDGMKQVQVTKTGETVRTIGEVTEAKKGQDIVLTLDIRMQKIAEDALKKNLDTLRAGSTFTSEFGSYTYASRAPNANVGAAIVMDVKTGEPLAIASYPDFDPNLFTEGISTENWDKLQGNNPRDPMSPRPLYNVAAMTAVQPGSTFKPITAITALESGMDPYRNIYDAKYVKIGDTQYSCLGSHGYVDLFKGLQVSCNFYFFDAATGRDWANGGADLGYANNISIDKITSYAEQFGLGVKSGAEIGETVIAAPTAERKLSNTKILLRNYLRGEAEYVFTSTILKDEEKLLANIDQIVSWTDENPKIGEIQDRLIKLGVKQSESFALAEQCKYTYFNYADWNVGDEFNIAIGQGETAFTPLQMARYTATLGNGGTLNTASLLKAVEGTGEVEREAGVKANISDEQYLKYIRQGMRLVVTGGSMRYGLENLGISVAGKSGTAQRAGYINPPDEVEYIKEHLSGINSKLKWADVETEMERLLKEYPEIYTNSNTAVRRAVINLSGRDFKSERLDAYKQEYDNFAWEIALAPADDPEIAVVVMLVQGGRAANALPTLRECIGQYFKLKKADEKNDFKVDYSTFFDNDNRSNTIEKIFGAAKKAETSSGAGSSVTIDAHAEED